MDEQHFNRSPEKMQRPKSDEKIFQILIFCKLGIIGYEETACSRETLYEYLRDLHSYKEHCKSPNVCNTVDIDRVKPDSSVCHDESRDLHCAVRGVGMGDRLVWKLIERTPKINNL